MVGVIIVRGLEYGNLVLGWVFFGDLSVYLSIDGGGDIFIV